MAEPNAILNSDKSAAPTVALSILCALMIIELAAMVRGVWGVQGIATTPVVATATAGGVPAPVAAGQPVPGSSGGLVIPPLPNFSTPIPSTGGLVLPAPAPILVPPPASAAVTTPRPVSPPATRTLAPSVTASSSVRIPSSRMTLPPAVQQPSAMAAPQPAAITPPEVPVSVTGNAQADELLEVAAQSRDLGDHEGALQALNRADLLVPNNPRIMREKAMTLQRLGKSDEAKSLLAPPPASSKPDSFPAPSMPSSMPPPRSSSSSLPPPSPRELLNKSFGSRPPEAQPPPAAAPPAAAVNGALSLGQCRIERDASVVRGERLSLKVPLVAAPGEVIDPNQMIIDVMFYDKVNNERIELTMADKPKSTFDTAGDFKSGHEVISVLYNLPEFTPAEISELGRHTFYGYIVKLYYKNRLMGAVATPPDLSTMGESGQGKRI